MLSCVRVLLIQVLLISIAQQNPAQEKFPLDVKYLLVEIRDLTDANGSIENLSVPIPTANLSDSIIKSQVFRSLVQNDNDDIDESAENADEDEDNGMEDEGTIVTSFALDNCVTIICFSCEPIV